LRCGAFDYRTDREIRGNNPYIITAAAADLISLHEGNQIYCEHGTGVVMPRGSSTHDFIGIRSMHREDYKPETLNHMTFVKVVGRNIAKFNVVIADTNDETTIVEWKSCNVFICVPQQR
jgi:hypothetical protein